MASFYHFPHLLRRFLSHWHIVVRTHRRISNTEHRASNNLAYYYYYMAATTKDLYESGSDEPIFFFSSLFIIFFFLFCYFIVGNEIVSGRHRWLTAALQCYTMKHHLIFHPAIYNNNNIVSGHRRRVIIFIIRLGLPAAVAWCRRGRIGTNTSAAAAHCNVTTHSSCKLHSE